MRCPKGQQSPPETSGDNPWTSGATHRRLPGRFHRRQLTRAAPDGIDVYLDHVGGDCTPPPGTVGARPHIHRGHEETFYVLSGELTVTTGDGEVILGVGDLAHTPRGSVHGFRNAGDVVSVRGLCLFSPAGYEDYFRDVHAAAAGGAEVTDELLQELRGRFDTESL